MIREFIEWHDVGDKLPDDDTTVMLHVPTLEPAVWIGWHANDCWLLVDGGDLDDETEKVERWAHLPTGEAAA